MLIKVMVVFLLLMALIAMLAKVLMGKARGITRGAAGRCPDCGRPRIGPGPCPCRSTRRG